jgi:SAM-dependent methyltransferase
VKTNERDIRKQVRKEYANLVRETEAPRREKGCGCCGGSVTPEDYSRVIGYTADDLRALPEGSNLGVGCGNPAALASIEAGETVLDLGSGAGIDCFIAARMVGESGLVIGVDMTPEMIETARRFAESGKYENVEFRLGEIENIPAADGSVDVILSNCVINLSTSKERVFSEAYRVLKPGGRLMISDIVLHGELPEGLRTSMAAYVSCIAGAQQKGNYIAAIRKAGFADLDILEEKRYPFAELMSTSHFARLVKESGLDAERIRASSELVSSISIRARK